MNVANIQDLKAQVTDLRQRGYSQTNDFLQL